MLLNFAGFEDDPYCESNCLLDLVIFRMSRKINRMICVKIVKFLYRTWQVIECPRNEGFLLDEQSEKSTGNCFFLHEYNATIVFSNMYNNYFYKTKQF